MPTKKASAGGDAPARKEHEDLKTLPTTGISTEEIEKTPSEILRDEADYRAMLRKQRFKRRWPEITKVKLNTRTWRPPPKPRKPPPIEIELPEIKTRNWIPPYKRRRRKLPKKLRIPIEEINGPLPPETSKLKKIWHNFCSVEKCKMLIQGTVGCNSKRYSSTTCGAQTGCIAVACRALLEEKTPAELVSRDVDELIEAGDRYYRQCMHKLKCYKGNPHLQLNQLPTTLFLHDTKYTVKMDEVEKGIVAKHPNNIQSGPDLMSLMEKRAGTTYMFILSIDNLQHFLVWGHPPEPGSGSSVKTICYIFDPHMLSEYGQPQKLHGAGAFIRYAGINAFVIDFLSNYSRLDATKRESPKPALTITSVEVFQKEPLIRAPTYSLDLKTLPVHCDAVWQSMNINTLIDKKRYHGKYPLASLSAVSLATSRGGARRKVREFYRPYPKDVSPVPPIQPEKGPANPTAEQIMSLRGEDFFLFCPTMDGHAFGRDDLVPLPKSETILHSPVEVANQKFHSQYRQLDVGRWLLRGTRHMASYRYQTFKTFTAIPACLAALAMLHRYKARAWNEDIVDETLDVAYNLYRNQKDNKTSTIVSPLNEALSRLSQREQPSLFSLKKFLLTIVLSWIFAK